MMMIHHHNGVGQKSDNVWDVLLAKTNQWLLMWKRPDLVMVLTPL